jgi:hypothetical protein
MTYEEISTKYPIGKLLARTIDYKWETGWCARQEDREYFIKNFSAARFYDNGYVEYKIRVQKEYKVQGWVVTDEGFFVAEDTWDGWQPLDEDDLKFYEKIGIDYEF